MKVIERGELDAYRERYEVISTRLFAGRTVIHVLSDSDPGDGFAAGRGRARGRLFLDPRPVAPRGLRSAADVRSGSPRFEFRYQLKNPVFWVAAVLFFLLTFGAMAIEHDPDRRRRQRPQEQPGRADPGADHLGLFFMFVTTAFVANVVVRDDETGFGPIVRSTRITKFDYLFGRFAGAFAVAALWPSWSSRSASWLGSLMPWVDPETLGPNRLADYAYGLLRLRRCRTCSSPAPSSSRWRRSPAR